MRKRRDNSPGALVELGYRLRYLGPGEVFRQVAGRFRKSKGQRAAPRGPLAAEPHLFDGIKHYDITPDEIYVAASGGADHEGLRDVVSAQAARIRELEQQLDRSRELLAEAHSLVLALRARISRRRSASVGERRNA